MRIIFSFADFAGGVRRHGGRRRSGSMASPSSPNPVSCKPNSAQSSTGLSLAFGVACAISCSYAVVLLGDGSLLRFPICVKTAARLLVLLNLAQQLGIRLNASNVNPDALLSC